MYPSIEHMVGPTEAAKVLQLKQLGLMEIYYDAWNKDSDSPPGVMDETTKKAHDAYLESVQQLENELGPHAHCNAVDCILWTDFSDYFKSLNHLRPRHHMTRKDVKDWFAADDLRVQNELANALSH